MRLCVFIVFVICLNYGLCVRNRKIARDTFRPNDVIAAADYYTKRNEALTIPVMIHLDRAALTKYPDINKHRRKKTMKTVFEKIFNEIQEMYRRPSLNLTVNIKLIDVKILKKKNTKILDENVSKYLKTYCQWQGEIKSRRQKLWYSILFTGLDLFYMDGFGREVRSSTGRGYMKGMCSVNNSCTLLEWYPNQTAYVLAHEIAHSLGISHDGPPYNECKGQRYIMNPVYNPHHPAKFWSPCNRRNLGQYLMSPRAWCLRPEGRTHHYKSRNIE